MENNKEILEMSLGEFAGIKPSSRPYFFIKRICGKNEERGQDDVMVKDLINLSPKSIATKLSEEYRHADFHRGVLKTLNLVRDKLINAGFTKGKYSFLKSPYLVTTESPDTEWETVWTEVYGLTSKDSKKLTELLKKVKYSVPQNYTPVLSNL